MIKAMLKPFFKRFFGLFISMVFVSVLSVGLLCCFGSCIIDVRNNYETFVAEYEDVDEQVAIGFTKRDNLAPVNELAEVKKMDSRIVIDCYLYKSKEKTIVSRVFSYNEETNTIFKRYVVEKVAPSTEYVNISVAKKFAENNDFKIGQTIELGVYDMHMPFYISELVETPEGIYPRANNYIWSDNFDFGYIYADEVELNKGLVTLAKKILDRVASDEEFKKYYEAAKEITGITIPDLSELVDLALDGKNYVSMYANQILIKNAEGQNEDAVLDKVKQVLKDNGVEVNEKGSLTKSYLPHIAYMEHALEQVQVASIFLPVFFYSVTMIVVGLFINQIIKAMTPQIGVFMSIGIDNNEVVGLFMIFTIIMALVSGLIGAPVGYLLTIMIARIMKNTYHIPTIAPGINVLVTVGAIVGLLIFVVFTTFLATRAIFIITPKDATISNESKRKRLPKAIEKFIDKAPMNIKLGTNSICQNPRRFFVSSFSIFASLVLILLSTLFLVSKEEMIDQSVNRRLNYDCQIYLTSKVETDFLNDFRLQSFVRDNSVQDCYYTYLKVDLDNKDDVYLECLAVNEGQNPLINIPDSKGHGALSVPKEGIILPKSSADKLNVKKGDSISINNVKIEVTDISYQYFHPITYLSKPQMDALGVEYVSSFIMNVHEGKTQDLMNYLTGNMNQCLVVYTSSLSKDLHGIFDALNVMIFIMVGFSVGMAFIILVIMSQNALMEQQRQLTIFRAIGFRILDISNIWTLQSVGQLLISSLFGVPAGALAIYILLRLCSSSSQIYPFIFSWPTIFIAIGFILLVIIATHMISMISIRAWNIADNTRSRE